MSYKVSYYAIQCREGYKTLDNLRLKCREAYLTKWWGWCIMEVEAEVRRKVLGNLHATVR